MCTSAQNLKCILRREARRSAFTKSSQPQTHLSVAGHNCATNPPAHLSASHQWASGGAFSSFSQQEQTGMLVFPCPSGVLGGHGSSLSSHIQRSTSVSEVAYALQTLRLPHRVSNHRLKVRLMTHAQRGLRRDGQTSDMSTRRWI